ncbi:hypothetical protein Hanom_Chr15g01388381 [Helianthus anomalus]
MTLPIPGPRKDSDRTEVVPEQVSLVQEIAVETNLECHAILENNNGMEKNTVELNAWNNFFAFSFVNKEKEGKLRKYIRLKTRQRKQSKSPQAHSRTSKRPRKDDPFDLNGMLGLKDETCSEGSPVLDSSPKEFLTPDLNVSRSGSSGNKEEGVFIVDVNNQEEEEVGQICTEDGDNTITIEETNGFLLSEVQLMFEEETRATVSLGSKLGAENLESFHTQVQQIVAKEGYQEVNQ